MSGLARGLRLSLRTLARSPGFTLPALLILAIGMTAATAIFTVVDSIVFRPLGLPDSERLVMICEDHVSLDGACIASPGNVEDFRRATGTLAELGFGRGWAFFMATDEGARGVRGGLATGAFFRALGMPPAVGRFFSDDEVGPGRDGVVLLSHAFWTTSFGADPSVVGTVIRLDGEPYEVVGVLGPDFDAPFGFGSFELWKPPHFDPLDPEVRGWRGFRAIGRLAPESSLPAAEAELSRLYAGLAGVHEEINDEWRLRVDPLVTVVVGDTRPVLLAFLGAAAVLLLIVCANVANLLLARGLGRRSELAVRAALGAPRGRLVGEIVGEALVLSILATLLAGALARGATRGLLWLAPSDIPRLDEVAMDGRVILFAAAASLAATALFAVLPAVRVTSWNLADTLKAGARSGEGRGVGRLRDGLVMVELALSVVLLASAGLLTRSFLGYTAWEPGFDRSTLMAVSAFASPGKYPARTDLLTLYQRAEESVAGLPGVIGVSTASAGPLFGGGDGETPFHPADEEPASPLPTAAWFDVGPGHFATLGLPMVEGREFISADGPDVAPVVIVNEALARRAWPGGDAVGRILRLPDRDVTAEVVGVVADVPPLTPGEVAAPQVYWPNRQQPRWATFFLIRTAGTPSALARPVADVLLATDPDLLLGSPRVLESAERRALVRPRFEALVLLSFALVALILSAVGVYAVVSYAVARRVREVGIRMALGAGTTDIVALLLRANLAVTSVGVAVGLAAAVAVGRSMQGMVHGVGFFDPLSLAAASLVLVAVATSAAWLPARRATRADPLKAIRSE